MIIANLKPIDEIAKSIEGAKKVMIAACNGCVTVCLAGGEREAMDLASKLALVSDAELKVVNAERQCDMEFLEPLDSKAEDCDIILSLACGAGVQFMAERYGTKPVVPGLNTTFIGVNRDAGYWTEMCQGCGSCVLEMTGGVCPVARCSKSHFNGPCGGSSGGKCEINPEIDCAWQLIYNRLKALGQLNKLYETIPARDWSTSRDGGPRSIKRPDVYMEGER